MQQSQRDLKQTAMNEAVGYPVGTAKLDLKQETFRDNRKAWDDVLKTYAEALKNQSSEGDAASQRRHQSRGQLLGELAE